jgi:hypothetical protein
VDLGRTAAAMGADLLRRVRKDLVLPVVKQLADGSYLSGGRQERAERVGTGPRRRVRCGEVDPTSPVVKQLDALDGHPVEVEQQRRIVDQARGSGVIVLPQERK